ncbi:MAG: DUF362 domain-containing protein, partial [Proteobacteria bacterium]|nr:DUF362 domain-containing protein [Pseudomonadota bacterium]NIS72146.1 DUF362 domain-containing protein [Pseudomonadota bacterium]
DKSDYYLHGYKVIYHDKGKIDPLEDMTTLFTRIYRLGDGRMNPFGSGILKFHLTDLPSMMASLHPTHCENIIDRVKVKLQFFSYVYGEVRDTYLHDISPFYFTEYENLVLSGRLSQEGKVKNFFFFSGIHDKDFPWGDKATFWDVALVIEEDDGQFRPFALTNHRIENLFLDVEKGRYHYEGEIFEIRRGNHASFSHMRKSDLPDHMEKLQIKIRLEFKVKPLPTQSIPFSLKSNYQRHIKRPFLEDIHEWLPHFDTLGIHLTPHWVTIEDGQIVLSRGSETSTFEILQEGTLGEAEISSFMNIRWPTLYYNYFCAIDPSEDILRLHIRSDTLRADRQDFIADKIEAQLGKIIDHFAWLDYEIKRKKAQSLSREEGDQFPPVKRVLLEINNDHYPTAVFQRRIVELKETDGQVRLALEENMDPLNLASIDSDHKAVVAAVKDPNKHKALEQVIEMTGFFDKMEAVRRETGKNKEAFSIIIKPNFMFMYSLKDRTTFTDPELVEHLVEQIWKRGYREIAVAEARSTYGTFFTNREVSTVASYIGLDGICPNQGSYRVIDLSLGGEEYEYEGKLGKHSVNRDWKNADFRISFAKNKTHSYSYYTLTIKNIYGALPEENKFKEYHCERDIVSTTIEYLKHFPVHFGFIDAHVSADGPFGIFADKDPNYTDTIIGGDDIVAVDWIGAAKMGLDPMVSGYMKEAVKAFGKPEIQMLGDRTLYPDWVNVPDIISKMAFGLDREYYFGNFFYSIFSTMDPYFEYREESTMRRIFRVFTKPFRRLFFEMVRQGVVDEKLSNKLYKRYAGMSWWQRLFG